jgi:hypothetical protein
MSTFYEKKRSGLSGVGPNLTGFIVEIAIIPSCETCQVYDNISDLPGVANP